MKIEDARLKAENKKSFTHEYELEFNVIEHRNIPFLMAFRPEDEDDTEKMRAEIVKRVNAYDELVECVIRNKIAWEHSKDKSHGLLPEVTLTNEHLIKKLELENTMKKVVRKRYSNSVDTALLVSKKEGSEVRQMQTVTIKGLTVELGSKEGIKTMVVGPYEAIKITAGTEEFETTGPAIILINQD